MSETSAGDLSKDTFHLWPSGSSGFLNVSLVLFEVDVSKGSATSVYTLMRCV